MVREGGRLLRGLQHLSNPSYKMVGEVVSKPGETNRLPKSTTPSNGATEPKTDVGSLGYPADPLHLFRALLRQASYLPDQASRQYFHGHITRRFRADWPCRKASGKTQRLVPKRRTNEHMAEARQGVKFLIDAHHGSRPHMQKVLEITYGRRGKRKHELLRELMPKKPIPVDETALQELADALESNRSSPNVKEPRLTEKMVALIRSQKAQKDQMFTKPNLKSTKPEIPEINSWGRPFPRNRAKNIKKQWYKETLERLMPPLPEEEWYRLKDHALGKVPWEGPRKRRVLSPGEHAPLVGRNDNVTQSWHTFTQRYMRRMWEDVFQQCPLMEWDNALSRWKVTWGSVRTERDLALTTHAATDIKGFKGVSGAGKIIPS